jgi:hypothetical protein
MNGTILAAILTINYQCSLPSQDTRISMRTAKNVAGFQEDVDRNTPLKEAARPQAIRTVKEDLTRNFPAETLPRSPLPKLPFALLETVDHPHQLTAKPTRDKHWWTCLILICWVLNSIGHKKLSLVMLLQNMYAWSIIYSSHHIEELACAYTFIHPIIFEFKIPSLGNSINLNSSLVIMI